MDNNILVGVFLSVIFILSALLHIRENNKLEAKLKQKLDADTAQWMVRFAWSRTLQLLGALGCCIVLFMNYDKELIQTKATLDSLTEMVEKRDRIDKELLSRENPPAQAKAAPPAAALKPAPAAINPQTPPPPAVVPAPAPAVAVQQMPASNTVSATATSQVTAPAPQPAIAPANSAPAVATTQAPPAPLPQQSAIQPADTISVTNTANQKSAANLIASMNGNQQQNVEIEQEETNQNQTFEALDEMDYSSENAANDEPPSKNETIEALYNPEKDQPDKQSGMDDIKKRYEDILVIHFFLKKCKKIAPGDYAIINHALSEEIATLEAPAEMLQDVISSANGSYNEIYARSPCNGKGIRELSTQYNNYIAVLGRNFPSN